MEEDLSHDAQARNVPRRGRWYTRLWPSCLGCRCIRRQRTNKYPLYLIGYDPTGPLQRAASVGDLDTTETLIHSSQHHVDESDRRSRTSLHYACAHNHPDVVKLLLENNSSINIQDDEGCTPLIKAAQRDNIDCVSVLLDYNADLNVVDFSGNTAFHHAVSRGNLPIVQLLLKHNVDIEAKTQYGLTPLQLAAFEQKPEMVEFLEAKCANAHAPVEINGPETPAQKTGVKHVSFSEEVFYFKEGRPLSRKVRPRGQLKSILKTTSQYSTASDQMTRRTPLWCIKGDNVRHTSRNKEESNRSVHRLQKQKRNVFTKSEVYVCSQGKPISDTCEEKASIMGEGHKPENFRHVPQKHRISVPEAPVDVEPTPSTSAAVIGTTVGNESTLSHRAPGDIDRTSCTTAADIWAAGDIELTPSPSEADSEFCGRRRFRITPQENLEFHEWLNREILLLTMEIEATSSQSAADSSVPADMEPIPSTSAASSRAPTDPDITPSQCAAVTAAIADIEPTFYPGPADIADSDEKHDSETASDTELDFLSLDIYLEHAMDKPCADPEPAPGPCICYSVDSTERADLNILPLLRAEDKYDSFSLDEVPTPVPDLDEDLAPTQDAEVFYDALPPADQTGHSRHTDRLPGFLLESEMLLLLLMPFLWLLIQVLSMMTGMRNCIRQVWHEENVEGPPTNKKEGSVAAAADP